MSQVTPVYPDKSSTQYADNERRALASAQWSNQALGRLIYAIAVHRDRQAFRTFFHRVAPRVKAYAVKNGYSQKQADKLTQKTMLFAWHRSPEYDPDAESVALWIYKLCSEQRHLLRMS